mmetsp:Transcript_51297/g.119671  ORF Transcript_51297/g.119671 Transcript_51297/m.119671 type:complete len:211 (+) Transcript_51297:365-997(+)
MFEHLLVGASGCPQQCLAKLVEDCHVHLTGLHCLRRQRRQSQLWHHLFNPFCGYLLRQLLGRLVVQHLLHLTFAPLRHGIPNLIKHLLLLLDSGHEAQLLQDSWGEGAIDQERHSGEAADVEKNLRTLAITNAGFLVQKDAHDEADRSTEPGPDHNCSLFPGQRRAGDRLHRTPKERHCHCADDHEGDVHHQHEQPVPHSDDAVVGHHIS